MRRRTFLALGTSAAIAGCNTTSNPSDAGKQTEQNSTAGSPNKTNTEFDRSVQIGPKDVYAKEYQLLNIPYSERPQWFSNPFRYPSDPQDPELVDGWPNSSMADIQGQTGHHPLRTTRSLGQLSDWYRMTGNEAYLSKAQEIRDKLINEYTTIVNNSFYFNYGFDFQIKTEYIRKAPWFSGMAQGTGLSAFVSWYEATGDDKWLADAESVYNSFTDIKEDGSSPYVSYAESGHLWLAEYPEPDGGIKVLNGFVIGLWGPFEYWLVTGDEHAKRLVQAYITTIEQNAMNWRNKGETSYYDLTSTDPAPEHYHRLHVFQFRQLAKYSGEEYFAQAAHKYLQDRPNLDYARCGDLRCN